MVEHKGFLTRGELAAKSLGHRREAPIAGISSPRFGLRRRTVIQLCR
jgi:hypothetical protein